MSIAVQKLAVSQEESPLKEGENEVTFTYKGMVDEDDDNDVSITATIEKGVPIIFKKTNKKTTDLDDQTFSVGSLDEKESDVTIVVSKNSTDGATAKITLVFKTAKGTSSKRDVSVTY